jgi:hypothetical protein
MKKNYKQPEAEVISMSGMSLMQTVSPVDPGQPDIHDIPTDDQW